MQRKIDLASVWVEILYLGKFKFGVFVNLGLSGLLSASFSMSLLLDVVWMLGKSEGKERKILSLFNLCLMFWL